MFFGGARKKSYCIKRRIPKKGTIEDNDEDNDDDDDDCDDDDDNDDDGDDDNDDDDDNDCDDDDDDDDDDNDDDDDDDDDDDYLGKKDIISSIILFKMKLFRWRSPLRQYRPDHERGV